MTTIEADTALTGPPSRSVRVAGRSYPLVLPTLRDPRLHLASVIITLQILGQTVFKFDLSIAQILLSLLTCALLELIITFVTKRIVAWPASAMLTGNGVAFVLRVPGTRHGDWWSLRGGWIFVATAAVSLLSKYVIRRHRRHVFNPSNFGLLLCFLVLGSKRADPLDFWWARTSPGLVAAFVVIIVGGLLITRRTQMLGAAVAFWLTFAALLAVLAASGHCMTARWHIGPVCGARFWWVVVTSPEILVFLFFMITDPKTAPAGRRARVAYGSLVALVAVFLVAPQRTEFGTKVGVLGALAILCAFRPLVERRFPAIGSDEPPALEAVTPTRSSRPAPATVFVATVVAGATLALLVLAGSHARSPTIAIAAANAATTRPHVPIPAAAIPPVTIDPAVTKIQGSLSAAGARALTVDVVTDLVLEGEALKRRDVKLATTVDVGPRYLNLEHEIVTTPRTREVVVTEYRLRTARVVLAYTSFQSGPQIALRVTGTIRRVGYRGTSPTRVITARAPFARTFVLLHTDGHYFIATDSPTH